MNYKQPTGAIMNYTKRDCEIAATRGSGQLFPLPYQGHRPRHNKGDQYKSGQRVEDGIAEVRVEQAVAGGGEEDRRGDGAEDGGQQKVAEGYLGKARGVVDDLIGRQAENAGDEDDGEAVFTQPVVVLGRPAAYARRHKILGQQPRDQKSSHAAQ